MRKKLKKKVQKKVRRFLPNI